MAGTPKQKQKTLYLLRILCERTDAEHAMTLSELAEELEKVGIKSERKSLYRDLHALAEAGFSVGTVRSKDVRYYWDGSPLSRRDFMLLANLIRISPAVPRKRKLELERKLHFLASSNRRRDCFADYLSVLPESAVTERVYSIAEVLLDAISANRKVRFTHKGSALRDMTPRRRSVASAHTVSPYRLVWSDGYYLVGADDFCELHFYRLDRMEGLTVTELAAADIREIGGDLDFDLNQYVKGVFSSLEDPVHMIFRVSEEFLSTAERRFPADSVIESAGSGSYLLTCDAQADDTLFGWLLLHSDDIRLLYPDALVRRLGAYAGAAAAMYHVDDAAE